MKKEQDYKVTHEFYIAGVKFHQLKNVIDILSEGDNLMIIAEPTNKFDPNAVRLEYIDAGYNLVMLGFVPKKFSSEVAAALKIGKELKCTLIKLDKKAKTWEQAKVEIREVFEEAGSNIGDDSNHDKGCREETK